MAPPPWIIAVKKNTIARRVRADLTPAPIAVPNVKDRMNVPNGSMSMGVSLAMAAGSALESTAEAVMRKREGARDSVASDGPHKPKRSPPLCARDIEDRNEAWTLVVVLAWTLVVVRWSTTEQSAKLNLKSPPTT